MGYYDREDPTPVAEPTDYNALTQFTGLFVRLVGVILLLVGLWVSLKVIVEAWDLYRNPDHIERFAAAIERGSNLDKTLAAVTAPRVANKNPRESSDSATDDDAPPPPPVPSLRLSYFLSWGIGILLLLLIGRLALAAVKTGGELALYDTEVKKFAQALLGQIKPSALQRTAESGMGRSSQHRN
jgi:di/tricarboxylate transporter